MAATRTVALRDYLALLGGTSRVDSFEAARRIYVDYHVLLCRTRLYSPAALLASIARGATRFAPLSRPRDQIGVFDSVGANGCRSLEEAGVESDADVRLCNFFAGTYAAERARTLARLVRLV